ncbi:GTP cyclohydrolase 1 type 2 [bioreactor metagenome]|uniref:GTP cyclohydrolase 1 type 2 n=1 Tax=bioreactor metagenome TaxID=1076179 RepID=A0A645F8Q4_9ZZZZ
MKQYYRLEFYVPTTQASLVKNAVFEAGGGRLAHFEHCAWETHGKAQLMVPGSGGQIGNVRFSEETKIEVIVAEDKLQAAVDALLAKHPAEQPVFCYYPVGIGFPPEEDVDA